MARAPLLAAAVAVAGGAAAGRIGAAGGDQAAGALDAVDAAGVAARAARQRAAEALRAVAGQALVGNLAGLAVRFAVVAAVHLRRIALVADPFDRRLGAMDR